MKASPASILSLFVAATVAPGCAPRPSVEPAPALVERIRAMVAERVARRRQGLAEPSEIDVDQPLSLQGCGDDDIFDVVIELGETYRIDIDDSEYGSDGNTTDDKLTVRGLARIVTAHL